LLLGLGVRREGASSRDLFAHRTIRLPLSTDKLVESLDRKTDLARDAPFLSRAQEIELVQRLAVIDGVGVGSLEHGRFLWEHCRWGQMCMHGSQAATMGQNARNKLDQALLGPEL